MTEPEHGGSDPTELSTRAVRDGDDWILDGHKWFTTGADGAAVCIVMAVTQPDAPPHLRASMFLVPTETPGFERVRNISVMGEAGAGWASHAEIRLERCRVSGDALLGGDGMGFAIAQQRLGPGRIHHCMRWIGVSERALELMCRYANTRSVGGRPLGHRQTIQNWIAESRASIDAARLLVLDAAASIERDGSRAARARISAIKYYVADVMLRVIDNAVQTHGALGVTDDTVLAWFYRHERAARIYDGPDEVHKAVVARRELARWE
jgi:acyl-CoA dehydrogenase